MNAIYQSPLRGRRISRNHMTGRRVEFVLMSAMLAGILLAGTAGAETHKEYRFNVGPKAASSVNNPYGSISVKPATTNVNVVVVNAVLSSDKVEVDNNATGNRVEV